MAGGEEQSRQLKRAFEELDDCRKRARDTHLSERRCDHQFGNLLTGVWKLEQQCYTAKANVLAGILAEREQLAAAEREILEGIAQTFQNMARDMRLPSMHGPSLSPSMQHGQLPSMHAPSSPSSMARPSPSMQHGPSPSMHVLDGPSISP